MKIRLLLALGLLAFSSVARAQLSRYDPEYLENLYGPVRDVSLDDLSFNAETYNGRAVRVKGRLGMQNTAGTSWEMGEAGTRVTIVPIRQGMAEDQFRNLSGQMIEVTGLFTATAGQTGAGAGGVQGSMGVIQFWSWAGPPEKLGKDAKFAITTLEQLVTRGGKMDGQLVRVVGKFRGRNLFADLPARSMRRADDWVIKDSLFAVWITNRKPKGDGFELDPSIRRDSSRWVEVIGRPSTRNGVVVIDAAQVSLTQPPTPQADAAPPPPPPERPKTPPMIVFSLPLDGDSDFDFSGRITVQFNNDMDEASFKGRVGLRYAGPALPGDPGFQGMRVSYNPGSKALIVDPGVPILKGRVLDLVLLTGIVDVDGQPLVRRDGKPPQGDIAEMLRFK
ncbi:MAG: Ig-like domain-containing protein [Vicinamibacteria bacterium]|nr:Ig-like domain-containing protein [Vicinamibacteria bacterium]